MNLLRLCRFVVLAPLFAAGCAFAAAPEPAPDAHPVPHYPVDVPPSATLDYGVIANQSGLSLQGDAHVDWNAGKDTFTLDTEVKAMLFGKIMQTTTTGKLDDSGLVPLTFTDKRFHKDTMSATFDRDAKLIRFSASDRTYPIKGGEQDRNSALWQLVAVARAAPARFVAGSEWPFFVVGPRDAQAWVFKVIKRESMRTVLGDMQTVHLVKLTADADKTQKIDIWLAPSLEWFPVRIRYSEPDGDYIEQSIRNVTKKAPQS